jgi:hypothetical protein
MTASRAHRVGGGCVGIAGDGDGVGIVAHDLQVRVVGRTVVGSRC